MRTADFDYDLPADRIATRPAVPRDAARLLVVPREDGPFQDRIVRELPDLLAPGDLLVVNDTRVIPARLAATRADTGGAVEVFLVRPTADGRWRVLLAPGRRMRPGVRLSLAEGVSCRVEAVEAGGDRIVRFEGASGPGAVVDVVALAERVGATPLPPYVRREADARDRRDYQTMFARAPGAVAAPTAGLHFTDDLLARLRARGLGVATITLHVGPGTFRPVTSDDVEAHRMDTEVYDVPAATAAAVAATRRAGGRVVAVGTTVVRTLEAAADAGGVVRAGPGETALFVRPGFPFRVVGGLWTNFHLPKSTLLMLVAAFAGRERALAAYAHAVASGYRFYSYGDASLFL